MKKLLTLSLALTASLASAQSYGHAHRDHHCSHGYRPVPSPSFGCLPSRPAGYWTTHYETVYVPGAFVAALNTCGQTQPTFVPTHCETISRQVWVTRSW